MSGIASTLVPDPTAGEDAFADALSDALNNGGDLSALADLPTADPDAVAAQQNGQVTQVAPESPATTPAAAPQPQAAPTAPAPAAPAQPAPQQVAPQTPDPVSTGNDDLALVSAVDPDLQSVAFQYCNANVQTFAEALRNDHAGTIAQLKLVQSQVQSQRQVAPAQPAQPQQAVQQTADQTTEINQRFDALIEQKEAELRQKADEAGKPEFEIDEMVENMKDRFNRARQGELNQADAAASAQRKAVQEADQVAQQFASYVDPDGTVYGTGHMRTPQQNNKLNELKNAAQVVTAGFRSLGMDPNLGQILQFCHRAVSSDPAHMKQAVEAQTRQHLQSRTTNRQIPPAAPGGGPAPAEDLGDQNVLARKLEAWRAGELSEQEIAELKGSQVA